MKIKRY